MAGRPDDRPTPPSRASAWVTGLLVAGLGTALVLALEPALPPGADPARLAERDDARTLWLVAVALLAYTSAVGVLRLAALDRSVAAARRGACAWRRVIADSWGPPGATGELTFLSALVGPVAPLTVQIPVSLVLGLLVPPLLRLGTRPCPQGPEGDAGGS